HRSRGGARTCARRCWLAKHAATDNVNYTYSAEQASAPQASLAGLRSQLSLFARRHRPFEKIGTHILGTNRSTCQVCWRPRLQDVLLRAPVNGKRHGARYGLVPTLNEL